MTEPRPHPLHDVAASQSTTPSLAGGTATGVLLAAIVARGQADLVAILLAAVIVVINLATPYLAARRTATAGEKHVTPVDAPQDDDGTPLVRQEGPLLVDVLTEVLDQLVELRVTPVPQPGPGPTSTAAMPFVDRRPAPYPGPPARRDPASTLLPPPSYEAPGRHSFHDGR